MTLVAVSKTFDAEHIVRLPAEHRVFGENRVQEAQGKWPALKASSRRRAASRRPAAIQQGKEAVALFDVIETVDRRKSPTRWQRRSKSKEGIRNCSFRSTQVLEEQKAGINPRECVAFVERCRAFHGLKIQG